MQANLINIGLAFIEGFALIISPCILPILPIILSGSLAGSKSRPLGIITGFVITFTIVTLFSRSLIVMLHISPDILRNISFAILFLLGVMMISTYLTDKFNLLTQRLTNVGSSMQAANNPQSGYVGGILFGGLVGIIWTPCAGPILAAIIVQVVVQETTLASVLTVIAFAIGAGFPMLIIAFIGREFMDKFSFIRGRTGYFRKALGVILIASVIYLIYSTNAAVSISQASSTNQAVPTKIINVLEKPYKAPAFAGIDTWINSPPLTMADLKGKVVLIDFWTYSCINCIRTLPYIKDWYAKYHDKGLVIIGIHSPEFQFEHDLDNVRNAVKTYGILYPVAVDNNFATWRLYHNEYWPAHYLINKNGEVVYQHFGEGDYDVTENNIRYLLGVTASTSRTTATTENYSPFQTPETYLGYARAEKYASPDVIGKDRVTEYHYPKNLSQDEWALNGKWIIQGDKIVSAGAGASIKLHFNAGNVYIVMGVQARPVTVKLKMNGELVGDVQGADVNDSQINVTRNRLYSAISLKNENSGILELTAASPGLEIYTFTFGN